MTRANNSNYILAGRREIWPSRHQIHPETRISSISHLHEIPKFHTLQPEKINSEIRPPTRRFQSPSRDPKTPQSFKLCNQTKDIQRLLARPRGRWRFLHHFHTSANDQEDPYFHPQIYFSILLSLVSFRVYQSRSDTCTLSQPLWCKKALRYDFSLQMIFGPESVGPIPDRVVENKKIIKLLIL